MSEKNKSRHSVRPLRNVARLNYKALHHGRVELSNKMSDGEIEHHLDRSKDGENTPLGASGGPDDLQGGETLQPRSGDDYEEDLEVVRMQRDLKSLQTEEKQLTLAAKKDNLRRQLEAQRQKVQNLRGMTPVFVSDVNRNRDKSDSAKSKRSVPHEIHTVREIGCDLDQLTIQQLRDDDQLRHKVQRELKKHGLLDDMSESSSEGSSSDNDSGDSENKKKKKHKHKKKSGINAKASDKVRYPQKWPHAHLQYEHVNKQVKYDELDFKLFVAGELEIISEDSISSTERQGRLKLLKKIVYYYATYEFKGLKAFYAAWLREIELGKKTWADDSQQMENAILSKYVLKGSSSKAQAFKNSGRTAGGKQTDEDRTWFCSSYQRNKCVKKSNHLDTVNGRMRLQSHICATCWLKDKVKLEHPECSSSCPHANH